MNSTAKYFAERAYKPVYHLGDRVFGKYRGAPFIGCVGVDHLVYVDGPPKVVVMLDLPLKLDDKVLTLIEVSHDDIRPLKSYS